mgnify:CR=1 FL=1
MRAGSTEVIAGQRRAEVGPLRGGAQEEQLVQQQLATHSAEADASATYEILEAQVGRYPELSGDVESLAKFTAEEDFVDFARRMIRKKGVEIFNFGKYKGRPVREVLREEPQYYDWMMKSDFALHTKQKLSEIFNDMMLKKQP